MGSLTRVQIHYADIISFLDKTALPKYAAVMDGINLYDASIEKDFVLIMGNEANGIGNAVLDIVENKITIPKYGELQKTESLNVATATAILLSEFKRN